VEKKKHKNSLNVIIQDLPRSNLINFLTTYWETLRVNGFYTKSSLQTFRWTLKDGPERTHRLHHHLILRHLQIEDDLHQWRQSIAKIRNLEDYRAFLTKINYQRTTLQQVRQRGERDSNTAHKKYISHIFAGRGFKDFEKAKQAFKKNLRYSRR